MPVDSMFSPSKTKQRTLEKLREEDKSPFKESEQKLAKAYSFDVSQVSTGGLAATQQLLMNPDIIADSLQQQHEIRMQALYDESINKYIRSTIVTPENVQMAYGEYTTAVRDANIDKNTGVINPKTGREYKDTSNELIIPNVTTYLKDTLISIGIQQHPQMIDNFLNENFSMEDKASYERVLTEGYMDANGNQIMKPQTPEDAGTMVDVMYNRLYDVTESMGISQSIEWNENRGTWAPFDENEQYLGKANLITTSITQFAAYILGGVTLLLDWTSDIQEAIPTNLFGFTPEFVKEANQGFINFNNDMVTDYNRYVAVEKQSGDYGWVYKLTSALTPIIGGTIATLYIPGSTAAMVGGASKATKTAKGVTKVKKAKAIDNVGYLFGESGKKIGLGTKASNQVNNFGRWTARSGFMASVAGQRIYHEALENGDENAALKGMVTTIGMALVFGALNGVVIPKAIGATSVKYLNKAGTKVKSKDALTKSGSIKEGFTQQISTPKKYATGAVVEGTAEPIIEIGFDSFRWAIGADDYDSFSQMINENWERYVVAVGIGIFTGMLGAFGFKQDWEELRTGANFREMNLNEDQFVRQQTEKLIEASDSKMTSLMDRELLDYLNSKNGNKHITDSEGKVKSFDEIIEEYGSSENAIHELHYKDTEELEEFFGDLDSLTFQNAMFETLSLGKQRYRTSSRHKAKQESGFYTELQTALDTNDKTFKEIQESISKNDNLEDIHLLITKQLEANNKKMLNLILTINKQKKSEANFASFKDIEALGFLVDAEIVKKYGKSIDTGFNKTSFERTLSSWDKLIKEKQRNIFNVDTEDAAITILTNYVRTLNSGSMDARVLHFLGNILLGDEKIGMLLFKENPALLQPTIKFIAKNNESFSSSDIKHVQKVIFGISDDTAIFNNNVENIIKSYSALKEVTEDVEVLDTISKKFKKSLQTIYDSTVDQSQKDVLLKNLINNGYSELIPDLLVKHEFKNIAFGKFLDTKQDTTTLFDTTSYTEQLAKATLKGQRQKLIDLGINEQNVDSWITNNENLGKKINMIKKVATMQQLNHDFRKILNDRDENGLDMYAIEQNFDKKYGALISDSQKFFNEWREIKEVVKNDELLSKNKILIDSINDVDGNQLLKNIQLYNKVKDIRIGASNNPKILNELFGISSKNGTYTLINNNYKNVSKNTFNHSKYITENKGHLTHEDAFIMEPFLRDQNTAAQIESQVISDISNENYNYSKTLKDVREVIEKEDVSRDDMFIMNELMTLKVINNGNFIGKVSNKESFYVDKLKLLNILDKVNNPKLTNLKQSIQNRYDSLYHRLEPRTPKDVENIKELLKEDIPKELRDSLSLFIRLSEDKKLLEQFVDAKFVYRNTLFGPEMVINFKEIQKLDEFTSDFSKYNETHIKKLTTGKWEEINGKIDSIENEKLKKFIKHNLKDTSKKFNIDTLEDIDGDFNKKPYLDIKRLKHKLFWNPKEVIKVKNNMSSNVYAKLFDMEWEENKSINFEQFDLGFEPDDIIGTNVPFTHIAYKTDTPAANFMNIYDGNANKFFLSLRGEYDSGSNVLQMFNAIKENPKGLKGIIHIDNYLNTKDLESVGFKIEEPVLDINGKPIHNMYHVEVKPESERQNNLLILESKDKPENIQISYKTESGIVDIIPSKIIDDTIIFANGLEVDVNDRRIIDVNIIEGNRYDNSLFANKDDITRVALEIAKDGKPRALNLITPSFILSPSSYKNLKSSMADGEYKGMPDEQTSYFSDGNGKEKVTRGVFEREGPDGTKQVFETETIPDTKTEEETSSEVAGESFIDEMDNKDKEDNKGVRSGDDDVSSKGFGALGVTGNQIKSITNGTYTPQQLDTPAGYFLDALDRIYSNNLTRDLLQSTYGVETMSGIVIRMTNEDAVKMLNDPLDRVSKMWGTDDIDISQKSLKDEINNLVGEDIIEEVYFPNNLRDVQVIFTKEKPILVQFATSERLHDGSLLHGEIKSKGVLTEGVLEGDIKGNEQIINQINKKINEHYGTKDKYIDLKTNDKGQVSIEHKFDNDVITYYNDTHHTTINKTIIRKLNKTPETKPRPEAEPKVKQKACPITPGETKNVPVKETKLDKPTEDVKETVTEPKVKETVTEPKVKETVEKTVEESKVKETVKEPKTIRTKEDMAKENTIITKGRKNNPNLETLNKIPITEKLNVKDIDDVGHVLSEDFDSQTIANKSNSKYIQELNTFMDTTKLKKIEPNTIIDAFDLSKVAKIDDVKKAKKEIHNEWESKNKQTIKDIKDKETDVKKTRELVETKKDDVKKAKRVARSEGKRKDKQTIKDIENKETDVKKTKELLKTKKDDVKKAKDVNIGTKNEQILKFIEGKQTREMRNKELLNTTSKETQTLINDLKELNDYKTLANEAFDIKQLENNTKKANNVISKLNKEYDAEIPEFKSIVKKEDVFVPETKKIEKVKVEEKTKTGKKKTKEAIKKEERAILTKQLGIQKTPKEGVPYIKVNKEYSLKDIEEFDSRINELNQKDKLTKKEQSELNDLSNKVALGHIKQITNITNMAVKKSQGMYSFDDLINKTFEFFKDGVSKFDVRKGGGKSITPATNNATLKLSKYMQDESVIGRAGEDILTSTTKIKEKLENTLGKEVTIDEIIEEYNKTKPLPITRKKYNELIEHKRLGRSIQEGEHTMTTDEGKIRSVLETKEVSDIAEEATKATEPTKIIPELVRTQEMLEKRVGLGIELDVIMDYVGLQKPKVKKQGKKSIEEINPPTRIKSLTKEELMTKYNKSYDEINKILGTLKEKQWNKLKDFIHPKD